MLSWLITWHLILSNLRCLRSTKIFCYQSFLSFTIWKLEERLVLFPSLSLITVPFQQNTIRIVSGLQQILALRQFVSAHIPLRTFFDALLKSTIMPLDTSTYSLALLRLDGRRWNELRRLTAQISTQPSSDGSSYLSMGNTQVLCTVTGPCDPSKLRSIGGGGSNNAGEKAEVRVEISFAGFAGVDRKKYGRNDK